MSSAVDQQDHLLAEMEKEAEETQIAELGIDQMDGTADPMSQILLAQLQQNALLLKKLVGPRHADPIVGLLSGSSDPVSGNAGGSGVKGCLAREAFIKASLDLSLIAQTVRRNALTELGLPAAREDGNLMRKYMERENALERPQDAGLCCNPLCRRVGRCICLSKHRADGGPGERFLSFWNRRQSMLANYNWRGS